MAELYIFDQDDNFITILSKETGLVDTWFKDFQNHIPDEPFVFNVKQNSPLLKHIADENQVAFYDHDNDLRLMRMKELYEVSTKDGNNIRVKCEPSYLELYDHFIEDRRIVDGTAQTALNRALDGSRYIGEVTVDLGLASGNFYWIDGIEAVFKIIGTWGGALKDTIKLDPNNEIIERKLWIVQRLGADNGLIVEPDYNAEQIERKTLSYVETALWGQGASLQIEDDEGEHTGGYTRYLTFEDVEWKVSNGEPVDKPKGQKWVGDPDALAKDGYLHNGVRKHRFGHFSNQDYETPEELLWATWQELQERKLKEIIHEATIYEADKKVSLGDTVSILNRKYNKPIELQSQITGLEYDILEIEEVTITVGKYIDMNEDPLQKEVDDLKESVNRPRPTKPIDNGSFPDIKPGIPNNVTADGAFQTIQLFWDYDSNVYISHYEVYGSQISDFIPDEQHLLYRGRVSAFTHEVATDQTWYYYVRAVNTRGTVGEFSDKVKGSSVRVISDDILFGSVLAEHLEDNLDLANKLSDGTLDWINEEPLYEIKQSENRILSDVGNRIGDVLNDIDLINDDLGDLHYQDVEINNRIDGLSTIVQDTTGALNDLTGEVEHQSTQISKWEQRADGFEQSVINVEGDLENAWSEITTFQQTAKDLTLSVSELETDFNDLEISGRNLIPSFNNPRWNIPSIIKINDYKITFPIGSNPSPNIVIDVKKNTDYTFTFNSDYARYYIFEWIDGVRGERLKTITEGSDVFTFNTDNLESIEIMLNTWSQNVPMERNIWELQLEKGNKATDWSPAPEDMADKAQLISYINLSTEGVRIHGEKVHISGQTIIDDGIIGSAAIANLAVDSFHLKQGIIDTVHIEDAAITDAKIHSLNADKLTAGAIRGIDIYGAKFRSDNGNNWMEIVGGDIYLEQSNGRHVEIGPSGLYGYNASGSVRFQADHALVTSSAFGTSNGNVYLAARDSDTSTGEARVVRYSSLGGSGSASDYRYLPIRTNIVKGPPGLNMYMGTDGEFRVMSEGLNVYRDVRAAKYYANEYETNGGYILYLRASNRVRVMGEGSSSSYIDLQANRLYAHSVTVNSETSGNNFYIGTNDQLRVTSISLWGGSHESTTYRSVRANAYYSEGGSFYGQGGNRIRVLTDYIQSPVFHSNTYSTAPNLVVSSAGIIGRSTSATKYKKDIQLIDTDNYADNILLLNPKSWYDKAEVERNSGSTIGLKRYYGLIAEDVVAVGLADYVTYDGDEVEGLEYDRLWTQLIPVIRDFKQKTEDDISLLKLENLYLKQKIKQLEEKVA